MGERKELIRELIMWPDREKDPAWEKEKS